MKKMLTVEVLASPADLAEWCRRHGHVKWGMRGCCPFPAVECPLMGGAVTCEDVEAWMWEELMEEEDGNTASR